MKTKPNKKLSDKTDKKLSNKNQIIAYCHCAHCMKELMETTPPPWSPRDFARLEVGWTAIGLQVRCVRHDCNVLNVDFEGCKHPAITREGR